MLDRKFGITDKALIDALADLRLGDNPITHLGEVSATVDGIAKSTTAIGYYRRTDGKTDTTGSVCFGARDVVEDFRKRSESIETPPPSQHLSQVKGWSFSVQPLGPGEIIILHPVWTIAS